MAVGPGIWNTSAQAAQVVTYLVNTLEAGTSDANPNDGLCETQYQTCSLRAAIEQANAIADPDIEVVIEVAPDLEGAMIMPNEASARMSGSAATGVDSGAYFHVTRTVTIDLDNRLSVVPERNDGVCAFWIEATNVKLRNFKNVYSGETAIVFGPGSDGSSLDGGSLIQTDNWNGERLTFIRPGADRITISNFTVSRLYAGEDASGAIVVRKSNQDNEDIVRDLTFRNVTIDNAPADVAKPACSSSAGTSCATSGIVVSKVKLEGLLVEGCHFRNFAVSSTHPRRAIDLGAALASKDIDIRDNSFVNIQPGGSDRDRATVLLPEEALLTGDNYVRQNTFDNSSEAAAGQVIAIGWTGAISTANSTQASNLYIQDNHFDGYAKATVSLRKTGAVTVRRNTFGTATGSAAVTQNEETWGWDSKYQVMVLNETNTANRRILTWYPVATRVTEGCDFQVDLSKPTTLTGYGLPNEPVTIDFYYTAERTAEVYLGSVSGVTADQNGSRTVTVPQFPPSDTGYLRVQTQGAPSFDAGSQIESSQYSRTLALPLFGSCIEPKAELRLRAWQDADPGAATGHQAAHDSVIASGTEIPAGSHFSGDRDVWFTYTVTNVGYTPLADVRVTDSFNQPICVIELIPTSGSAGCVKLYFLSSTGHSTADAAAWSP